MQKNATMYDVAKLAKVSSMTVSRVVNNSLKIKPETRERVLEAIKELDYYPSSSARALSKNKTCNLGLLVGRRPRFDDFFNYVARAIEEEAQTKDYSLIVSMQPIELGALPMMVRQRKVDGIIAGGPEISAQTLMAIQARRMPTVLVANFIDMNPFSSVVADDIGGAERAVSHLIGLGHKRIAFISSNLNDYCIAQRLYGYFRAHQKHNLQFDQRLVIEGEYSRAEGRRHVAALLSTRPAPTASFCSGDLLAIGLIEGLRHHGLRVPADFAVVGFDDLDSAHVTQPPLTTVHVDKEAMGRLAVRKFFEILKQPDVEPAKVVVPTQLVVRGSCGDSTAKSKSANIKTELEKQTEGGDNRQAVAIEAGN